MSDSGPIVNRVANSGLITLNLEEFFPVEAPLIFDIKDHLFKNLILKEKDFRSALKEHDWAQYEGKDMIITCSTDAIIPVWAYMLIAAYAEPVANSVYHGSESGFYEFLYKKVIDQLDAEKFKDQRIVIKGCSNKPVPEMAYTELVKKLRPFAQSIMYGEPCSTVPIFKRPRTTNRNT